MIPNLEASIREELSAMVIAPLIETSPAGTKPRCLDLPVGLLTLFVPISTPISPCASPLSRMRRFVHWSAPRVFRRVGIGVVAIPTRMPLPTASASRENRLSAQVSGEDG